MRRLDLGPGWVALMCAFYYINPCNCFLPFCAAVAVHELGHAAALRICGVPIYRLRCNLGGAILDTGPMDCHRELICALAGPGMNLLLLPLGRWFPTFAMLSLCLAVLNLLPIPPLDGGRVLQSLLLLLLRPDAALLISRMTGLLCGILVALAAIWTSVALRGGVWPILVAALTLLRLGWNLSGDGKIPL